MSAGDKRAAEEHETAGAAAGSREHIEPDTGRVILHLDADCFYCQVEEVRDPSLCGRPLGVTQKYLVVTCNYVARQLGVTKLMGVAEARKRCPGIVLVSGEDLTPYRTASKQIMAVLQRYGAAEKLGLDEIFVDVTAEAKRRLAALSPSAPLPPWHGHVHSSATRLQQDSQHRPMDLRAVVQPSAQHATAAHLAAAAAGAAGGAPATASAAGVPQPGLGPSNRGLKVTAAAAAGATCGDGTGGIASDTTGTDSSSSGGNSWEALLRIGSVIAFEARAAVRTQAGYRTSAGVACNKLLAKLCSGLHKPDDQTVLPPPQADIFVAPLPVRALPGVGYKMERDLEGMGIATAADLRAVPRERLVHRLGERVGAFLYAACRGKDPSPVQEKGPPKSVTVEDSMKACPGYAAAEKVWRGYRWGRGHAL